MPGVQQATLTEAEVIAVDEGEGAVRVRTDDRELIAPLHSAAVAVELGDRVQVTLDGKEGWARVVVGLDVLLPELRAQGLFADVNENELRELVVNAFDGEALPGLDGPDILRVLYQHYGREDDEQELVEEEALGRAVRDRVLVFNDAHETPDLVEDAVAALADALLLDVELEIGGDYNDVFDALKDAVRLRTDHAYLLPPGVNEVALLIRAELAPSKLRLFTDAEQG